MAGAVARVLDHPDPYVRAGLQQARRFTWERCAREHEAVYREVAMMQG